MMHSINELYKINGTGYYTKAYIEAHNIPKCKRLNGSASGWETVHHIGANKNGYVQVHTLLGTINAYLYGEKTWFDTEAERDEYRAQRNADKAEQTKKNQMIKIILSHYENMSISELEKVVATL